MQLIIGADLYPQILLEGLQRLGGFIAQHIVFGWTITVTDRSNEETTASVFTTVNAGEQEEAWQDQLAGLLRRF